MSGNATAWTQETSHMWVPHLKIYMIYATSLLHIWLRILETVSTHCACLSVTWYPQVMHWENSTNRWWQRIERNENEIMWWILYWILCWARWDGGDGVRQCSCVRDGAFGTAAAGTPTTLWVAIIFLKRVIIVNKILIFNRHFRNRVSF